MSDPVSPAAACNKKNKKQPLRFIALLIRRLLFFASSSSRTKAITTTKQSNSPAPPDPLEGHERKEEIMTMEMEKKRDDAVVDVAALQRSVKQLHFGGWEEKEAAAVEIKRLAMADRRTRRSLADLGVIPSLVSMLDSKDHRRRLAIEALIELADGTFTNKALMVKAGLLAKLPQLTGTQDFSRIQELTILLLSISSLAKTQFPITSSHILPFLIEILDCREIADQVKVTCLATLYNLSTKLDNITTIVSSGAVHLLLRMTLEKSSSEGALAIMGNLVVSPIGKKAIEDDSMVPKGLIDIMTWDDRPKCQELVAYILMVLAHKSTTQRQKMAGLGIVPILLELALLGSPLAQKRAFKILQWVKNERQTKMRVHSGPQAEMISLPSNSQMNGVERKECQKAVKRMVKQSLDMNMELITRRANMSEDTCRLKALVVSSSSKSLPY